MTETNRKRPNEDGGDTATDQSIGEEIVPTDADDSDALAMAQARARVYGLLAAAFDGETGALSAALERDVLVGLADALPAALETADVEGFDHDAETLSVGYDNLFVVPGAHYVPPFASGHVTDPSEEFESDSRYHTAGDAGELLGDPAAGMARLYDATGFEPQRGDGIPDHVAASFEFMRALCEREADLLRKRTRNADALEAIYELQAATLSRLGWLDRFEVEVRETDTEEGVFAALARIARTFAAWDARKDAPGRGEALEDGAT